METATTPPEQVNPTEVVPTPAPQPPKPKAATLAKLEATAAILGTIAKAVAVLAEETILRFAPTGLSIRAVDPAHVAMVSIELPSNGVAKYAVATPGVAGVDVKALAAFLKLAPDKANAIFSVQESSLTAAFGGYQRTFQVLDAEAMSEPKVPKMDLQNVVFVKAAALKDFLTAAAQVSDHISVVQNEGGTITFGAQGDGVQAVNWTPSKDDLGEKPSVVRTPGKTLFSLDYIESIAKVAPSDAIIQLETSPDYPGRFSWQDAEVSISYLLAPRIESE